MSLQAIKDRYEYGLDREGLVLLADKYPDIKVCMKLHTYATGDSRPIMRASDALAFLDSVIENKTAHAREVWII